jgi:hypothetical protein
MKTLRLAATIALLFSALTISVKADDLNKTKMEKVTRDILDMMVKGDDTSNKLKKFISEEWLDKKKIKIKNYLVNNYYPEYYEIVYTGSDICAAVIGGQSWSHLLIFKFTDENGIYRVVPMGISKASNEYIDPWYYVKDYLCTPYEKDKE